MGIYVIYSLTMQSLPSASVLEDPAAPALCGAQLQPSGARRFPAFFALHGESICLNRRVKLKMLSPSIVRAYSTLPCTARHGS